ncbi:hypothetical protein E2562_030587 [Oryza meyeriana var. granulata]|uniref:Uncharacterized protein n=1 Tax=Oryza meyeriana var. granulata TaxID=110450 RepID=A0A6G1ER75_9ORYZ|nr:hypothetical protein E2562_030587 [Oryza meyeriana var. granulata]
MSLDLLVLPATDSCCLPLLPPRAELLLPCSAISAGDRVQPLPPATASSCLELLLPYDASFADNCRSLSRMLLPRSASSSRPHRGCYPLRLCRAAAAR